MRRHSSCVSMSAWHLRTENRRTQFGSSIFFLSQLPGLFCCRRIYFPWQLYGDASWFPYRQCGPATSVRATFCCSRNKPRLSAVNVTQQYVCVTWRMADAKWLTRMTNGRWASLCQTHHNNNNEFIDVNSYCFDRRYQSIAHGSDFEETVACSVSVDGINIFMNRLFLMCFCIDSFCDTSFFVTIISNHFSGMPSSEIRRLHDSRLLMMIQCDGTAKYMRMRYAICAISILALSYEVLLLSPSLKRVN